MRVVNRLARVLLAAPFVLLGYEAAAQPGGRAAMADRIGVPEAETAVRVNGVAMVVGGIAMATGVLPRAAALGLAASLVPTTAAGHSFWLQEDADARKANRIHFLKNGGLIGGLLLVAAGPSTKRKR